MEKTVGIKPAHLGVFFHKVALQYAKNHAN